MGLLEVLQSLINSPMSYNNVRNSSYEPAPIERPTERNFMYSHGTTPPTLDRLLAMTQPQLQSQEQSPSPSIQQIAEILRNNTPTSQPQRPAPRPVQQARNRPVPYDYAAIERFAEPAYREGPNANIMDDSRARAMAWLAQQQGG